MKKLRPAPVAILILVVSATCTNAAVVFTFDPKANRVVNGNLATYTLSFDATPGQNLAGFYGTFSGNNAFNGPMVQQLANGSVETPTRGFSSAIDESIDSHFLVLKSEILGEPFETASSLGGVFSLTQTARASTKPLIQIVAHKDAIVFYDFIVIDDRIFNYEPDRFRAFLGVPEASSAALALCGLACLLKVRRRLN